jgi:hypothetical protein
MVDLLKSGDREEVLDYQSNFFRAPDLELLANNERAMVKEHLLSRLYEDKFTIGLVDAIKGIGPFLTEDEIAKATGELVRLFVSSRNSQYRFAARQGIIDIFSAIDAPNEEIVKKRLDGWAAALATRDQIEKSNAVKELKEDLEFPF